MAATRAADAAGTHPATSALLRRLPLFHSLSDADLTAISGLLRERAVGPDAVIVQEGEPGTELFVITSGHVRVVSDAHAESVLLARLGPGEFFGEMALVSGEPRSAAVISETETHLLVLLRDDFVRLSESHPQLRRELDETIAHRREDAALHPFENEALTLLALSPALETVTIGRDPLNDVVLSDPTVSAHHAELRREGATLRLRDLRSAAGTYHNRRPVRECVLESGDEFQIGSARLFLQNNVLKQFQAAKGVRVEARGVGRTVGAGRHILRDADLAVYPGELVALVGPSGAGKTTLLTILLGLAAPSAGTVFYDSLPLNRHLDLFRPVLGYVPQDDIIHLELPLEWTLRYAARLRLPSDTTPAELETRIDRVLEQVGLTGERSSVVASLSGGQRKRASIAVELLSEPRILFLDEPTSGLDPRLDAQLMRLFRRMADQGRTVILTTHATRNIDVCDRIVVLHDGRSTFVGSPAEAHEFFQAEEFVDVYDALAAEPAHDLADRFRRSPAFDRNVTARLLTPAATETHPDGSAATARPIPIPPARQLPSVRAVRAWMAINAHQTQQLVRRTTRIMRADRITLALRLLGAPLIGALLLAVFDPDIFAISKSEGGNVINVLILFHILGAVALFLTSTLAATEITKEAKVYERERLVNLSPFAYVLSKVVVLSFFSVVQAFLLVGVVALGIDLTDSQVETFATLFAALTLTSLVGMSLGLLVSSLSRNADQAITVAVILLIPQLIFAGAIVPLSEMLRPARIISDFMVSKWSLELFGGLADLDTRVFHQSILQLGQISVRITDNPFSGAFDQQLVWRWLVLAAFAVAFIAATALVQARKGHP